MDILKPNFVVVDGRCYRKLHDVDPTNFGREQFSGPSAWDTPDLYADEPTTCKPVLNEDQSQDNSEIEVKFNGSYYSASAKVSPAYFGVIIGRGGETMRRIQQETEGKLQIPQAGATGPIVITGKTARAVHDCYSRIIVLIESARKRFRPTHFLSIPLVSDETKTALRNFISAVEIESGMKREIFQEPAKLHFTLCMLLLNDAIEIKEAVEALQTCNSEIIQPLLNGRKLKIELSGLEFMNDDPSRVDVLYAKVKPGKDSDLLQQIVDQIYIWFKDRNILHVGRGPSSVTDTVKLHATVMNSKFDREGDASVSKQQKYSAEKRIAFDARRVLNTFGEFEFGSVTLSEVHISKRGEFNSNTGFYKCEASVKL